MRNAIKVVHTWRAGFARRSRERQPRNHGAIRKCSAFTLIELVVVIGIITFLAAVTLPAVSRMIEDSRHVDTENKIKGLLRSARGRAILNRQKTGLFFFLQNGVQKAAFIESELDPAASPEAADRFRVLEGDVLAFPPPFRVAPRTVLQRDPDHDAPPGQMLWTDAELASNNYRDMVQENNNGPQNHRNFFTVLFSREGHLISQPVVLIHDGDAATDIDSNEAAPGEVEGFVTGLPVATVSTYQSDMDGLGEDFPTFSGGAELPAMVNNGDLANDAALNFASVDGLLVYDESVFRDIADTAGGVNAIDKRQYLTESAAPYYISRQTGVVVAGPKSATKPPA